MFDAQFNLLSSLIANTGILRSDLLISVLLIIVLVLLVLLITSRNQRWTVPGR